MTKLVTTLLASSLLLAGCFGGEETSSTVDLSKFRQQCMELSGFTGEAQYATDVIFIWRADGEMVAECEWHDGATKFIGILGAGHPADN